MCVQIRKIVKQEAMGELVSSANTSQQNASGGILKKRYYPPGEDAAARQPEAQSIVLQKPRQPHFFLEKWKQKEGYHFFFSVISGVIGMKQRSLLNVLL